MSSGKPFTAGQRTSSMRFRRCGVSRLMTQLPEPQSRHRYPTRHVARLPLEPRWIVTLGETRRPREDLRPRHEATMTVGGPARAGMATGLPCLPCVAPCHCQEGHETAVAAVRALRP